MSRYENRTVVVNGNELYEKKLEKRGKKRVNQYNTPVYGYPSIEAIANTQRVAHHWTAGDRYWKLAAKYYNDMSYWWVIAMFNQKPTEAHCNVGDTIYVPLPLEEALNLFGGV